MICTDLHRLAMSKSEMLWRQGHMRQIRPQFGLYEAIGISQNQNLRFEARSIGKRGTG